MAEFFSMGGYAAYVWPAYGIAAVILVAMLIVSLRGLRRHEALLKTLETSRPGAGGGGIAAPITAHRIARG